MSRSSILPTASGVRFGTVTAKLCWAERPPASVAVTVTVALPAATPVTVATLPATATEAISTSELAAVVSQCVSVGIGEVAGHIHRGRPSHGYGLSRNRTVWQWCPVRSRCGLGGSIAAGRARQGGQRCGDEDRARKDWAGLAWRRHFQNRGVHGACASPRRRPREGIRALNGRKPGRAVHDAPLRLRHRTATPVPAPGCGGCRDL